MSSDISNLRKFVSPEIIFGVGARKSVSNYAKTFGARKVLLGQTTVEEVLAATQEDIIVDE